jgi:glycopeptide antibiotics resistance protein
MVGCTLYALVLAVIALWPTHIDDQFDVVDRTPIGQWLLNQNLTYSEAYFVIEFWANVALYVPLGLLALLISTRIRWWHVVALAFAASTSFEVLQAGLRPARTAALSDVVANTLGAAIGAAIFVSVRSVHRRLTVSA